jgi:hypothetical protein
MRSDAFDTSIIQGKKKKHPTQAFRLRREGASNKCLVYWILSAWKSINQMKLCHILSMLMAKY